MSRWIESAVAALLLQLLIALPSGAHAQAPACTTGIVASKAGPVCGMTVPTSGKAANAYLGIPFAESTAGEGRWQPPTPKRPWTGTLSATQFGSICPQTPAAPAPPEAASAKRLKSAAPAQPPAESEDCLSVNVWTPADAKAGAGLTVMVFIYGGGFEAGGSNASLYDGSYLAANRNVVIVSFNYRVGALGFLAADGLTGNYGFLDQQLALNWVHDNIASWGGDPEKVTLFGQSAGAMSVGLHVFSAPGSAKLFRAAIMESNFFSLPYKTLEEQIQVGNLFKQSLNCRDLKCLKALDVNTLVTAQWTFAPQVMAYVFVGTKYYIAFTPAIDGKVLTREPVVAAAEGGTTKPILMGTNKDDGLYFAVSEPSPASKYAWEIASLFGHAFERVIAKYPPGADPADTNEVVWGRVQTDYFNLCSTRRVAERVQGPVYAYLFNHQPSFQVGAGSLCVKDGNVCHGDELPFVFNTAASQKGTFTPPEAALSETMMTYWTNFATYLTPDGPSGSTLAVPWPRFTVKARKYMSLDVPSVAVQDDPYRQTCAFWDGIGYNLLEPWGRRSPR